MEKNEQLRFLRSQDVDMVTRTWRGVIAKYENNLGSVNKKHLFALLLCACDAIEKLVKTIKETKDNDKE